VYEPPSKRTKTLSSLPELSFCPNEIFSPPDTALRPQRVMPNERSSLLPWEFLDALFFFSQLPVVPG